VHVLPGGLTEWRPSITLYDLILEIPKFVKSVIESKDKSGVIKGNFHLGVKYDIL
jgi:hypothetical protein